MNRHTADRVAAIGDELISIHRSLRLDLVALRDSVAAAADSEALPIRGLPAHCLAFCSAVTVHHTDEDKSIFPELAAELPELAGVLDELAHDHVLIAGILRRVQELVQHLDRDNLPRARDEIEGLAAVLESHFRWEERRIVGAAG
ncbi:hemerythrin domain-containing protein [Nakamurella sp. GG22]